MSNSKQLNRQATKPNAFSKKDFSVVSADWTGSESYWTATGEKVYTTNVGVDTGYVVIKDINTNVWSNGTEVRIDFPDGDNFYPGQLYMETYYPNITKREIHFFDKNGPFFNRMRIDVYDGATLLCSYYIFRDFSDSKSYKYGIRVKHLLTPSSFYTDYYLSDDSQFADYGIVLEEEYSDDFSDPAEVVGKTYYASIPIAYLPDGRALTGSGNDYGARLASFAALVLSFFAIIYILMNIPSSSTPVKKENPKTA